MIARGRHSTIPTSSSPNRTFRSRMSRPRPPEPRCGDRRRLHPRVRGGRLDDHDRRRDHGDDLLGQRIDPLGRTRQASRWAATRSSPTGSTRFTNGTGRRTARSSRLGSSSSHSSPARSRSTRSRTSRVSCSSSRTRSSTWPSWSCDGPSPGYDPDFRIPSVLYPIVPILGFVACLVVMVQMGECGHLLGRCRHALARTDHVGPVDRTFHRPPQHPLVRRLREDRAISTTLIGEAVAPQETDVDADVYRVVVPVSNPATQRPLIKYAAASAASRPGEAELVAVNVIEVPPQTSPSQIEFEEERVERQELLENARGRRGTRRPASDAGDRRTKRGRVVAVSTRAGTRGSRSPRLGWRTASTGRPLRLDDRPAPRAGTV